MAFAWEVLGSFSILGEESFLAWRVLQGNPLSSKGWLAIKASSLVLRVLAVTGLERLGNQILLGKNPMPFWQNVALNSLVFGAVEVISWKTPAIRPISSKKPMIKFIQASERIALRLITFQTITTLYHIYEKGNFPSQEEWTHSLVENVLFTLSLECSRFLLAPVEERMRGKLIDYVMKNYQKDLARLGAQRSILKSLLEEAERTNQLNPKWLSSIENVWQEELKIFAKAEQALALRIGGAAGQAAFAQALFQYQSKVWEFKLQLARFGINSGLRFSGKPAFLRWERPGFLLFADEQLSFLKTYYQNQKGSFRQINSELYEGTLGAERFYFIPESSIPLAVKPQLLLPPGERPLALLQSNWQDALRAKLIRIRAELPDQIVRRLATATDGEKTAQYILSGQFDNVPGFNQILRQLKSKELTETIYPVLKEAEDLQKTGGLPIEFEIKSENPSYDIDVGNRNALGEIQEARQIKVMKKGLHQLATTSMDAGKQLINAPALKKVVVLYPRIGTMGELQEKYMPVLDKLQKDVSSIHIKIVFPDGKIFQR